MYIKRKLESTIIKNIGKREYLAIVGPRQAGKTTLIKKIQSNTENSIYLTFEDREILELFDQDIKMFAKEFSRYKCIFIDEFQYSRFGGQHLKYLYDVFPDFKFIISGSSAIDLTIKALKYLVGRVFIYNLYQLDFSEFLSYKAPDLYEILDAATEKINFKKGEFAIPEISSFSKNEFDRVSKEFLIWGGYPRVAIAETPEEKKEILKNIHNTYFLRDVKDIVGLIDDFKLSKLIKALSAQTGQMIEYRDLGKLSEYDYISLKKYLNLLEKTFICSLVRPFYRNKRTELVKNPKIYFFDNGLRNHILNNFNPIIQRADKGAVMENYVFTEFIKREIPVNYWRTKQKAEVDFIIEANESSIIPVEVKNKINGQEVSRSFRSFLSEYSPDRAVILNQSYIGRKKISNTLIYFIPFWLIK